MSNKPKSSASKSAQRAERSERAAVLMREQRARERRRNLITGGFVALVLVVLVAVGIMISKRGDVESTAAGSSEYGVTIGDADAPHSVVVYEDFLCPACGEFEAATEERLVGLAEEGKVYVEYRPFVLLSQFGDYSARATEAFGVVLSESGPVEAKSFHDLLFADQPEESAETFPDADWLVEKAVEAGASEDDVRPGIEAGAGDFAEGATAEAAAANVQGTPTVVVDGETFNGGSYDDLFEMLD